jgi:hypothetical protein
MGRHIKKRPSRTDDYSILKNNDFNTEKELVNYIVDNIEYFCEYGIGCDYDRHILEFKFDKVEKLHDNGLRVDIVIIDKEGRYYFIEVKSPKKGTDMFRECMTAIGQCLAYHYLARVHGYNYEGVYLVTSGHSNLAPLIIRDSNLPITYLYVDKKSIATAKTEANDRE